ncbi:interleukin-1 receptor type 2 isoform X1 [Ascaphus truei]|uniref:interleukin-1 receptor type 2 isoform X1 n=1 Tax=Ascaphus truei TaxID=8439 RepID=UPI003F59F40A
MWFPYLAIGTSCLLETLAFGVHRLENPEKCRERISHYRGYLVLDGEPTVLKCPSFQYLQLDLAITADFSLNLIWTKNDSESLILGEESRIQQHGDSLWFFPASSEDSGVYSCILRNSSFCIEVTISLNVMRDTEVSLPDIAYEQNAFVQSRFQMFCPDLSDFTKDNTDVQLKWYKEGELLPKDNSKYTYLDGTTYLYMHDVHNDDEGFYKCELAFTHGSQEYTISRIIHLRTIAQEKRHNPVIVNPTRKTIAAALGSKLMIPCKVFTGQGGNSVTIVWWLANDSYIDEYFEDGRVKEGTFLETTENDDRYIEVPLIFEIVKEEDFSTDFKCIASNEYGFQVLPTQIREAAPPSTWYIAAVPAVVVSLIVVIMFTYKYRKSRNEQDYTLAKS